MIEYLLEFFASYLIEFMLSLLVCGLFFRYMTYVSTKEDEAYFSKFTREVEANMEADKVKNEGLVDIESYLTNFLGRVNQKLPHRSLRFKTKNEKRDNDLQEGPVSFALKDYVGSKHGLIASIQSESNIFTNKTPPDFTELTHRILEEDKHWTKLFGKVPIDGISRLIDILPSLFIVFGVFGTFIGISMALPEIAKIDFNDLDGSSATLTNFVINVTFAMKTSIAGIFFSLVLTFLNTIYPIRAMRFRAFKKVETSFQMLWYHIHNESSKEKQDEVVFTKMLDVLNEMNDKLGPEEKKSNTKKAS